MKKPKFLLILSSSLLFLLTLGGAGNILMAQSSTENSVLTTNSSQQTAVSTPVEVTPEATQSQKRLYFLNRVKDELQMAQQDYYSIHAHVENTQGTLNEIQEQNLTLSLQLQNLDELSKNTATLIENVLIQVTEKENSLKQLTQELEIKNLEIQNQKQILMDYLKVLYAQESAISDTTNENSNINMAKLLLSDKPAGEILQELKYFQILEVDGHEIFSKLENLAKEQTISQFRVDNARTKLTSLYDQLAQEQQSLQSQRDAKQHLLKETQGKEEIYQKLLGESKQEQGQTLQDIKSLRDNLAFIQEKITALGDKFNPDDFKSVLNKETTSVYEYIKSTQGASEFTPRWPVSPNRGISAYFHDESYRRAMGMPHEAIDIPTAQGSPIHAPADGVIYKTRDNGYGYSYIILAHSGGFMTLYGHVSEIRVIEGQKIKEGEVIGLSGATPGTKGAGLMTTGAHLHLEVIWNGKHVDPLDYLPLSYLPLKSLPAKYQSRATGEQLKIKRLDESSVFEDKNP